MTSGNHGRFPKGISSTRVAGKLQDKFKASASQVSATQFGGIVAIIDRFVTPESNGSPASSDCRRLQPDIIQFASVSISS
jgi:hypothetical protein